MRTLLSADNYRLFFENALNAIAFHEIILDAGGKPVDYVFLKVNPAFEAVTGFKAADIQGKRVREVIPGIENDPAGWIGKYGRVALTGEELKIDQYSALLGKWFRVVAFQTRPGQFCTFFDDITSQKKTEDQLRRTAHELEKRTQELDGILSSVQDYLYILNPDGEFVFANQKLLDLWGLTLEEATGKNFRQLDYPPEMESIFMNALREVVTTGRVVKNTTRYTSPGGQSGSYENLLAPMSGPDKRVTFIAGSSREISERLDLEAQLSTGRELLQTIIDSIPVMLAIWDPGIQVLQLNKAFDRIVGWSQKDHQEKGIMELVYPDPEYRQWVSEYMNSLQPGFRDIQMVTKSGEVLETSWANIPISDGRNIGIGIDVSERKKYEKVVTNLYNRLQTVVDHIADGVIVFGPKGKIIEINKAAERILERVSGKMILPDWGEFSLFDRDGNEMPEEQWPIQRCLKGEKVEKAEFKIVHKPSGSELTLEFTAIPVFDREQLRMAIITMHDLTDRKNALTAAIRANEVLNEKNCELEKMQTLHENLLYIIAHDLKAPVANMKLAMEVLKGVPDPEMQKEVFRAMPGLIQQQDRILNGLIEVMEVQSIREIKQENIRLEEFVREIIKDHEEPLAGRKGKISCDFQDAPVVRYNPSFMRSIFVNLITNSIKYADKCRDLQIEIISCRDNDRVLITFRDNGTGIDLVKYGKKLFQPFQRFSVQSDGTGIGLYILKSLVEKNGGKIEVESNPGKGTCFYCHL